MMWPYERFALLCALFGIVTMSCRLRGLSVMLALGGILALFFDLHGNRMMEVCHPARYRKRPLTMEPMEEELEQEPEMEEEAPPEMPPPPKPNQPYVAPPPDPTTIVDEDLFLSGLVVGDYAAGSNYARFIRPKGPQCTSKVDLAGQVRGRNRSHRVVPQSFTHGGYRSNTGQTTSFSFN